jgi:hypothetical protein
LRGLIYRWPEDACFASFSVSHTLLLPLVFLVSVAVLLLLCLAKSAGELRVWIRPFFLFSVEVRSLFMFESRGLIYWREDLVGVSRSSRRCEAFLKETKFSVRCVQHFWLRACALSLLC